MDDYTLAIARILKREQQRPGQPSYDELAEITGFARSTISRVLTGRRDITLRYLRALCEALGLDPAQVVDEAETSLADTTETVTD